MMLTSNSRSPRRAFARRVFIAGVFAMGTSPALLAAQAPIDERVVDSIVTAGMREHRLVGLSVAIVRGGRVQLLKAYGDASRQPLVPVDTLTRFSIGSVTKEFVAALTMMLQEDGKLSVHDTLAKW